MVSERLDQSGCVLRSLDWNCELYWASYQKLSKTVHSVSENLIPLFSCLRYNFLVAN